MSTEPNENVWSKMRKWQRGLDAQKPPTCSRCHFPVPQGCLCADCWSKEQHAPTAPTARPQAEVPEWANAAAREINGRLNTTHYIDIARIIARHAPAVPPTSREAELREALKLMLRYAENPDHQIAGHVIQDDLNRARAALSAPSSEGPSDAAKCLATLLATIERDGLTNKLLTPEFHARCRAAMQSAPQPPFDPATMPHDHDHL